MHWNPDGNPDASLSPRVFCIFSSFTPLPFLFFFRTVSYPSRFLLCNSAWSSTVFMAFLHVFNVPGHRIAPSIAPSPRLSARILRPSTIPDRPAPRFLPRFVLPRPPRSRFRPRLRFWPMSLPLLLRSHFPPTIASSVEGGARASLFPSRVLLQFPRGPVLHLSPRSHYHQLWLPALLPLHPPHPGRRHPQLPHLRPVAYKFCAALRRCASGGAGSGRCLRLLVDSAGFPALLPNPVPLSACPSLPFASPWRQRTRRLAATVFLGKSF